MGIIHLLDQQTANSIAAGEVVERPASVVKELAENALDAGASTITVEISGGGILSIVVIDNGRGLGSDDARMAFYRHATSKITRIEDLDAIATLGFRGEALASIAAVSKLTLKTRQPGAATGTEVRIEGGELLVHDSTGCSEGTSILVEQLFYNTPARFKFLKKDSSESAAIAETIERLILSRPDVSFRLLNNGQELMHSPGNNDLLSAIYAVYGRKQAATCVPVTGQSGPLRISGYIARPEGAKNNRSGQTVLVNGRWIRSKTITAAIDEAYKTRLMKGRFAFAVLRIDLPPELVDVNVHPQKLEVRFWKDGEVFSAVYQTLIAALVEHAGVLPSEPANMTSGREVPIEAEVPLERAVPLERENRIHDPVSALETPTADRYQYSVTSAEPLAEVVSVRDAAPVHENPDHAPEEARSSLLLKAADLMTARVIGTLFKTYILLELGDELIMVDQHAAHEKIIYERLRDAYRHEALRRTQPLLVPLPLTVTPSERIILESEQTFFAAIGFSLESFGNNSMLIRSIPDLKTSQINPEAALRAALQTFLKSRPADHHAVDELLYQVACKAAVKANDRLSSLEIQQLIGDLVPLENPYTCPHGRPVIIRMSRLELEKKFKRVL